MDAPGRSKKRFEMLKTFVARPGSLPESTGKVPGSPGPPGKVFFITVPSRLTPVDPGGPGCLLRRSWVGPVHHGSPGFTTVALRKHSGRLRVFVAGRGSGQKHPDFAPVESWWLRLVPVSYDVSKDGHGAER